jgi:hypothetical protein
LFCANCSKTFDVFYVSNQLTRTVRQHIEAYYKMNLVCSEPSCGHEVSFVASTLFFSKWVVFLQTRQLLFRKRPMCTTTAVKCNNIVKQEPVDAGALYNQLLYYRSLFDLKTALVKEPTIKIPPEHNDLFRRLYEVVDRFISQSAYNQVSLKTVLSYYGVKQEQDAEEKQ